MSNSAIEDQILIALQKINALSKKSYIFCALLMLLSIGCAAAKQSTADISVEFRPVTNNLSLNEPVVLQLTIRNNGSEKIKFNLGADAAANISFAIKKDNGKFKLYHFGALGGMQKGGRVILAPEEEYSSRLIINKWYRFDSAGTYVLQPLIDVLVETLSSTIQPTFGYPVTLLVTPRNKQKSTQLADKLLALTLSDKSHKTSHYAEELSYLVNPVAVPALSSLLTNDSIIARYAIKGLMRIADINAVAALAKYQNKLDEGNNAYLSFALHDIAKTSEIGEVSKAATLALNQGK